MHPEVSKARARVAALSRADIGDPSKKLEAKRDLQAAKLQDYIERTLAVAPPLTDEQRTRLAELLRPARELASRRAAVASRIAELDGGAA